MNRDILGKKENIIYEDDIAVAILPEKPVAKGHIVIFPKKEVKFIEELSEDEIEHLFYLASYSATTLFESLGAHGTNIITNEDEFFSMNVIARKQEDGLNFQWQPKQLTSEEMDTVVSDISASILSATNAPEDHAESMEEIPTNPLPMSDQPGDEMTDDEENYLMKQLERIP